MRENRQVSDPSMAESALMILHGLRAGSPVVTDTGCCPSAAPMQPPRTFGNHNLFGGVHHSSCLSWMGSKLRFL
jgi:hypothetical protein